MNPSQTTPKHQNIQLTPHRTPINPHRSYLTYHHQINSLTPNTNNNIKLQQQPDHHHSQTPNMIEQLYQQQPQLHDDKVIWGTNISTTVTHKQLAQFINNFEIIDQKDQIPDPIYNTQLENYNLDLAQGNLFLVKGKHLKQWDNQLYFQLIFYPAEIITIFDQVIKDLYYQKFIKPQLQTENYQNIRQHRTKKMNILMVSIIDLSEVSLMRSLNHKHINRLISFRGIVIRCSEIFPEMKTAMFQCLKCKAEVSIDLINAKVAEPKTCIKCQQRDTFHIIHSYCHFTDKQYVKIQQLPQYVPQGQTPTSMNILCYDNNVNGMRPGDRVEIVGLFRAQSRKVSRFKSNLDTVFSTFTDLISFKVIQQNKFRASLSDNKTYFNDDQKQIFHQIARSKNVIDDLIESFANSISGHENIKKGLLAQIFGGAQKTFNGRGRFRSDINICLVGDPSTAKSQLLKQVHAISPRGIYTSGKGSSAVGLTANVRRDPQTRQFVLQSGALVLSDLGICCIDQFDKMDQNSKLILLQAMQQQTISVAKAGIVCQLNSRTSILSAANPVQSKYNIKKSVVDNINLHPALLSRFDLIYIILDIPNEKTDRFLAKHILSIYSGKSAKQRKNQPKIPRNIMTKYITYAREYCQPQISQRAGKILTECYLQMRNAGNSKGTVSATIRQLQSLIRISQSFAKMKLSDYVEEKDVMQAFQLIREAMKQSAIDPQTGLIDMDVIVTGTSSASKKRIDQIVNIMKDYFQANQTEFLGKKISFDKTCELINNKYKTVEHEFAPKQEEIFDALKKLQNQGIINLFSNDRRRPMFKYLSQDNVI